MSDSVNNLLGSLLGTFCFAILLYGSATSQAYNYWWNYPNDVKFHRRIVISVWLIDTIHTALCIALLYHWLIIGYGNLSHAENTVWPGNITMFMEVVLGSIVQSFYISQVWVWSQRSVPLCLVMAAMLSARIALGLGTCVLLFKYKTLSRFAESQGPLIITVCGLSLGAAVDLMVSLSLVYHRLRTPRRAYEKMHVVEILQSYVINSGVLTMVISLTIVFLFALQHDNFVYVGLVEVQAKLYANSLFATVTERAAIRAAAQEEEVFEANGQVPVPRSHNLPSHHISFYKRGSGELTVDASAVTSVVHINDVYTKTRQGGL